MLFFYDIVKDNNIFIFIGIILVMELNINIFHNFIINSFYLFYR